MLISSRSIDCSTMAALARKDCRITPTPFHTDDDIAASGRCFGGSPRATGLVTRGGSGLRPGASLAILLTASTGCAMTVLDTNVVASSSPTIARDLGASFAEVQWVSALCSLLRRTVAPRGSIADRLGRRKVFRRGIGLFALASLCAGPPPRRRRFIWLAVPKE